MSILDQVTAYDALVRRCGLSILYDPGDLALTEAGDIKLTRDGDLFFGVDAAHNAMRRLVLAWSYAAPSMKLLFQAVRNLRDERPALEQEMELAHARANPFLYRKTTETEAHRQAYHVVRGALDAGEIGCSVLSGSLIITVQGLLSRFRGDAEATTAEWAAGLPAVRGVSVGRLIVAAANAFRHDDEWAVARARGHYTDQQRRSVEALQTALQLDERKFSDRRSWEHALDAISGGVFDALGAAVLTFANDVALKVRNRGA